MSRPQRIGQLPRVTWSGKPKRRHLPPKLAHVTCGGATYRVRVCQWRKLRDPSGKVLGQEPKRLLVEDFDGTVFVLGGHRLKGDGPWRMVQPEPERRAA